VALPLGDQDTLYHGPVAEPEAELDSPVPGLFDGERFDAADDRQFTQEREKVPVHILHAGKIDDPGPMYP
jgi:hypothetical protein